MSEGARMAARTEAPEHPGSDFTGDSMRWLADPANPLSAFEHGATRSTHRLPYAPDDAGAALQNAMRLERVPVTVDEG